MRPMDSRNVLSKDLISEGNSGNANPWGIIGIHHLQHVNQDWNQQTKITSKISVCPYIDCTLGLTKFSLFWKNIDNHSELRRYSSSYIDSDISLGRRESLHILDEEVARTSPRRRTTVPLCFAVSILSWIPWCSRVVVWWVPSPTASPESRRAAVLPIHCFAPWFCIRRKGTGNHCLVSI